MKKYEILYNEATEIDGVTLYPIKALKDFFDIKKGQLGGYVQNEFNLSQLGNCWIRDNACVYGKAKVIDNAQVCGKAHVFDRAMISGDAHVFQNAWVYGHVQVSGNAEICEYAKLCGNAHISGNAVIEKNTDVINLVFNEKGISTTFYSTEDGIGISERGVSYSEDEFISYLKTTYDVYNVSKEDISKEYIDYILLIVAMKSKLGSGKKKRNLFSTFKSPVD